jgi:glycosyltransferase involved in cell wall biosynthesis
MRRIAFLVDTVGPYHSARLRTVAPSCHLSVIQVCGQSEEYAWEGRALPFEFDCTTLVDSDRKQAIRSGVAVKTLRDSLTRVKPEVVFVPGWSDLFALECLRWCVENHVPAAVMSDSTEWDDKRVVWREWIKSRLVSLFSAAFVAGAPHRHYIQLLGMPAEKVITGYDVVDNEYFARQASLHRINQGGNLTQSGLPGLFFLATARFIEKKNLLKLIDSYARYRTLCDRMPPWDLVIVGDGPLRDVVVRHRSQQSLQECVHLPGFKQYGELPRFYGLAKAFIQASSTEQWGLAVNEAMASSLPVLVSDRCGCALDLVYKARNGFTFSPGDQEQIARRMLELASASSERLSAMGAASLDIVRQWGLGRFRAGFLASADAAIDSGGKRRARGAGWVLRAVIRARRRAFCA